MNLLAKTGLEDSAHTAFWRLSGGEAQRLGLARAIACEHDLLLIDEPTAQLDYDTASIVIELIEHLAVSDRVVVLSTHDQRLTGVTDKTIDMVSHHEG
ncbi:ABC transporter [Actinomyces ruminicola]|uniref:ABC transporter n=2 Tax=Actinomyces ruminicola TaxID=332524 RepID=A0A1H0AAM9_9ACTO|nr:ABC transporter [Actinomyces ruminicola]